MAGFGRTTCLGLPLKIAFGQALFFIRSEGFNTQEPALQFAGEL
jgi:hypothetical protein